LCTYYAEVEEHSKRMTLKKTRCYYRPAPARTLPEASPLVGTSGCEHQLPRNQLPNLAKFLELSTKQPERPGDHNVKSEDLATPGLARQM
jgi:hypothetical protein